MDGGEQEGRGVEGRREREGEIYRQGGQCLLLLSPKFVKVFIALLS